MLWLQFEKGMGMREIKLERSAGARSDEDLELKPLEDFKKISDMVGSWFYKYRCGAAKKPVGSGYVLKVEVAWMLMGFTDLEEPGEGVWERWKGILSGFCYL